MAHFGPKPLEVPEPHRPDRLVLLEKFHDGRWNEMEDYPDTPVGYGQAEGRMLSAESATGAAYRIIRRIETILVKWE